MRVVLGCAALTLLLSGLPEDARAANPATRCFNIAKVDVEGLSSGLDFVRPDVDRYAGTCMSLDQINVLVSTLSADLVRHGFVTTRVRVPPQNLTAGTLRLIVIPGIIGAIRYTHPTGITFKNAYPTRSGQLLNVRDLEQGLEQMKRVPSQDVQMAISPDALPGQSDVVLDVHETKRWHLDIDVNDAGSQQTGKMQGSVTLAVDNLFHANDLFNVALNTAVQGGVAGGSRGNSAYYSIPYGYWTAELSASRYTYDQVIQGRDTPYTLAGNTHETSLSLERMLYRSQRVKTSLTVSLVNSSGRNFLDDSEIDVQRRDETYGELKIDRSAGDGQNTLDIAAGLRLGMPMLGTLPDIGGVANPPTNYYSMGTLDVSASVPVKGTRFRWEPQLHGQFTGDLLYSNDQFAIGNRYTVRGFDGSASLAAESGYYLRNDFVTPVSRHSLFYIGFDTGAVWGPSAQTLAGTALTGLCTGFKGQYGRMSFDVFSGVAIHAPANLRTAQPAGGVDVQFQF